MNAEIEAICNRLLGALLNGVYQGLLLTFLIGLALKLFRRLNAATRHAAGLAALAILVALPLGHFLLPNPIHEDTAPNADIDATSGTESVSVERLPGDSRANDGSFAPGTVDSAHLNRALQNEAPARPMLGQIRGWRTTVRSFPSSTGPDLSPEDVAPPIDHAAADEAMEIGGRAPSPAPRAAWMGQAVRALGASVDLPFSAGRWTLAFPSEASVVLISSSAVLAAFRLAALGWQCWLLGVIKRRGIPAPDWLNSLFDALCREMRLTRGTRLFICAEIPAPMAVGFRRPAVLLPARILLRASAVELEQLLRHELAHVQRWDDWSNLAQQIVKAVLFFHPGVWWLSRRLTIEREIACDNYVVSASRAPRQYALFLTEFAGRMRRPDWPAAPAAWSNKSQLKERIDMILDPKRNTSTRLGRMPAGLLTTAAVLMAILALQTAPRVALGDERTAEGEPISSADDSEPLATEPRIKDPVRPAPQAETFSAPEIPAAPATPAPAPRSGVSVTVSGSQRPVPRPARVPRIHAAVPHPPHAPHAAVSVAPLEAPRSHVPRIGQVAQPSDAAVAWTPHPAANPSIERRLERLERMVESLIDREKPAPKRSENYMLYRSDNLPSYNVPSSRYGSNGSLSKPRFDSRSALEEVARAQELASREAERAAKELDRAVRELAREQQRSNADTYALHPLKSSLQAQRDALEAQRQSLERQLKSIEKQLEDIKKQHEKMGDLRPEYSEELKKDAPSVLDPLDETAPKRRR